MFEIDRHSSRCGFRVASVLAALALALAAAPARGDDLAAQLEKIRVKHSLPALGGAIVSLDKVDEIAVAGVRSLASEVKAAPEDLWHLGSCTKAMTATLIALLVERGDLKWDTTLGDALPALKPKMAPAYRSVTLEQLLTHRAGVPSDLQRDGLWGRLWSSSASPLEQRELLTETVLAWGPVHAPGTDYLYANAGFAIAGHVAEVKCGKPWEELIRKLLFEPLGMTSAGFGAPGSAGKLDQPLGHDGARKPVEPGKGADNPPAIGPGGTVHCSLADWAKFVQLHLKGERGDVKLGAITLHAATMKKLHAPAPGEDASYAMGWAVAKCDWAGGDHTVLTHDGSNTMWYCEVTIAPDPGFAVLTVTNFGGTNAQKACKDASWLLIKRALVAREEAAARERR